MDWVQIGILIGVFVGPVITAYAAYRYQKKLNEELLFRREMDEVIKTITENPGHHVIRQYLKLKIEQLGKDKARPILKEYFTKTHENVKSSIAMLLEELYDEEAGEYLYQRKGKKGV